MKIIIGCSWAISEWNNACNLAGPGFGQLLMLHDQVTNLAMAGGSNSMGLDRLEQFFHRYQVSVDDDIYWVVTCPSRCREKSWLLSEPGLHQAMNSLLDASLKRAVELVQFYNIRLHLIGGLCDLDEINQSLYKDLVFCVPSWGQLLNPDYKTSPFMPDNWADLGMLVKQTRPDLQAEWITISDKIINKQQSWKRMSNTFFKTDGCHPDSDAHRKLRDHLWPEWAHKF